MAGKARIASREDQVQERKRSLLDAAATVIARKGLTGITMNDIAREAGCSYGVAAFHFKSKDGLILAALDQLVAEYDAALNRPSVQDKPADRLKAMVLLDFDPEISNEDHVAVWSAFWAEAARNHDYRRRLAELKARYHAFVKAEVIALARERKLKLDATVIAATLNALIDGLWIANQVNASGIAGQKQARNACFLYLRSIFPDDF
ncbi:TetR family transcriptional regulator C-terminal domain-containing protein [Taklimakanibacter lacteus]|uniref:TetR family transcriptional regulator C-terminal domain-containing protein n=1 Tax=Taklimakanibacter lacteus TaxID=2268456 RepID=UPI000E66B086